MIAKWFIIGYFSTEILLTIARIGKPRGPITPTEAAVTVAFQVPFIIAMIAWWQ